MESAARGLVDWAYGYEPTGADLELARRALVDTVAVTLAARADPVAALGRELGAAGRWAAVGHVRDFDDLHVESTTHVSVVCVPATLAAGGDARAYLAGAGVLARLGVALGWEHYASGWHVTCTAGAPAAAVAASVALGLPAERAAVALALAVPAAGGVQRAFGTAGKALQVGFAVDAGVRAARLAAAGASADPDALADWLRLVGGDPGRLDLTGPAVPGGLAIKLFPCCYALQRPIAALREVLPAGLDAAEVESVRVTTPAGTVQPLIHHRPRTGLEGKFSLEYALAAALLDPYPGFASFTDEAVARPAARRLVELVGTTLTAGGDHLLAGEVAVTLTTRGGGSHGTRLAQPPGSPGRPPTDADLAGKLAACGPDVPALLADLTWSRAAAILADQLPPGRSPYPDDLAESRS
jgi:2-methylcitrate dehydratase PrpD